MKEHELNRHVDVAVAILRALDCPRALAVVILLRYKMWDEIANLKLDPLAFNDPDSFYRAHQATKLLSKAKWLPTSFDKKQVAKIKFLESEERCRRTNITWASYRRSELKLQPDFEQILHSARRKIGKVLGDSLYRWTELCDFGPGADGSTDDGMTSAYNKLSTPGCVTFGAYPYLNVFCELTALSRLFVGNTGTGLLDLEISRGNSVTFVPKSAKTDRPIAVEPRWNMFFQKGLGRYLRNRLKHFGVNLDYQGLNQALAIYSSRTGKYATIDLASASDTVSKEVVLALLPEPWLTIFSALRSPAYRLDGEWHGYHKWSSMGNGYTFELESLLFWALCSSVCEDVSVYGDDLIVPTESYELIVRVLDFCGFEVNTEKSFSSGYFRESCGQDAFDGVPVTPIYWKEPLDDQGALTLVNQITVLAARLGSEEFRFSGLKKVWKDLVYQLPKRFQQRGPTSISTVVHDIESSWAAVRKSGWDGVHINIWVPVPRRFRYSDFNAAVTSLLLRRGWSNLGVQLPRGKCYNSDELRAFALGFSELPSFGSHGFTVRDRVVWKKRTVFIPRGGRDVGPWGR
uniref:RNA-directed RNA polymerase n=1 Tax=Leviviridae sp. TaxID=2027243 RepID=A0A514D9A4_9VIRU|nr:MAG: RNA-dependent RNA polymerase [Leviviridae sp.]